MESGKSKSWRFALIEDIGKTNNEMLTGLANN